MMVQNAEKLVEIEQMAAMVVDQEAGLKHAMGDVVNEGEALLRTLCEAVKDALPMLCSSVTVAADAPFEARHNTPPLRAAPWKGFRVSGRGPTTKGGVRITGEGLYLREDGTFARLEYSGGPPENRWAWDSTCYVMAVRDVAARYDVAEILQAVSEGLLQQLAGRKDEHTEELLQTAERYRAVSLLLKVVR